MRRLIFRRLELEFLCNGERTQLLEHPLERLVREQHTLSLFETPSSTDLEKELRSQDDYADILQSYICMIPHKPNLLDSVLGVFTVFKEICCEQCWFEFQSPFVDRDCMTNVFCRWLHIEVSESMPTAKKRGQIRRLCSRLLQIDRLNATPSWSFYESYKKDSLYLWHVLIRGFPERRFEGTNAIDAIKESKKQHFNTATAKCGLERVHICLLG